MATKKKMNEEVQAPEVGMTTEQTMEQTVPEREEEHVEEAREQTPETMEATEAPADTEKDVASAKKNVGSALESLSVLADRHRVPSWQQAALLRFMDWTDDKLVSDAAYRAALEELTQL